jgi:hypothetical protein
MREVAIGKGVWNDGEGGMQRKRKRKRRICTWSMSVERERNSTRTGTPPSVKVNSRRGRQTEENSGWKGKGYGGRQNDFGATVGAEPFPSFASHHSLHVRGAPPYLCLPGPAQLAAACLNGYERDSHFLPPAHGLPVRRRLACSRLILETQTESSAGWRGTSNAPADH